MDPLSLTGTLIAVLQITTSVISVCYDYRAGVASASREVVQITESLNALKDVLESLLRLVETSESGEDRARLSNIEVLAKDRGTLESCLNELIRLEGKLQPEKGWRKLRRGLVWPLKEGEMKRALAGLERYKSTMLLAISADQATLSLAIQEDLGDLTDMFQKHALDQTRQDIFKWLAAPDPFANHALNRKKRQSSTGTWLLTSRQYDSWLYNRKSFFWLYGIPGCGKTVLCSTVIEQLIRYTQQDQSVGLAYFYYDLNGPQKQDTTSLIRSLITQLSSQCSTIPAPLADLYGMRQNGRRTIDEEAFLSVLQSLVWAFHDVYLVFDALDESSNLGETLQFIHRLKSWNVPQLHILVTSRQLPEIADSIMTLTSDRICLHECNLNGDIHIYLADRLMHDQNFSKWPLDIRNQVMEKLVRGEAGMFQWVVCQLDMLQKCLSVAAVRKALSTDFPQDLEGTYDQILHDIPSNCQPEASKVLQALIATRELLSVEEIVDILAVDLDSTPAKFDPDARPIDPRSILSLCSSLITTTKASQLDFYDNFEEPVTVLRLAHASVAEYFARPKPEVLSQFYFSHRSARRRLGQACVAYLMAPEFGNVNNKRNIFESLELFPFLRHAAKYWPLYFGKEKGDPEESMDETMRSLIQALFATSKLPNGGNFAFWVGLLIPEASFHDVASTQPMYYTASFGLLEVTRLLLDTEKDIDIDALGGRARASALHVAVYRDHIDVANLLLERGASPDTTNITGESALYWATLNKNQEMSDLLLRYGASPLGQQQLYAIERRKRWLNFLNIKSDDVRKRRP
ncbi:uncharacterized protein LY89DRAFT_733179 [Mollisia scopiformis]|uniref:NACHT domain-containing protein n=1 Tax=Mollisia scopiformis TaxID=149040 RepID=A0A194XC44_MOLSC|nr:uncharacterized protein LY89DRAFT_733179 [Mollisia scopiformis]KUJ17322.1 hypothetical protein LY89DRAFT_733179 [Mollisia scopiformis]